MRNSENLYIPPAKPASILPWIADVIGGIVLIIAFGAFFVITLLVFTPDHDRHFRQGPSISTDRTQPHDHIAAERGS